MMSPYLANLVYKVVPHERLIRKAVARARNTEGLWRNPRKEQQIQRLQLMLWALDWPGPLLEVVS